MHMKAQLVTLPSCWRTTAAWWLFRAYLLPLQKTALMLCLLQTLLDRTLQTARYQILQSTTIWTGRCLMQ